MSHNPEIALLRIQRTLLCSVAQMISISVTVLSMLSVSYYHELQDLLWCIQMGL